MNTVDILIKNGRVFDPGQNIDEIRDIGIYDDKIVFCDDKQVAAARTIDAEGCFVLPGLIDFHTHAYSGGSGFGVKPDLMLAYGVTSTVDAGSSGCDNFNAFYTSIIAHSTIRIKSYVNVFSGGMYDAVITENFDPTLFDEKRIRLLMQKYGDEILGLKIRITKKILSDLDIGVLEKTVELAEKLGIMGVCVHTTDSVAPAEKTASILRKDDIFCHCFQGFDNKIIDDNNKIYPGVWDAYKRGVIFDECNGSRNNSLDVAKAALAQGFYPNVISTDASSVTFTVSNRCRNLPFVMSRYLELGMPLDKIVKAVTTEPARLMRMSDKIGTLKEGACADIAILKLEELNVMFDDAHENVLEGSKLFVPQMTICNGNIVYCQPLFNNKI